MPERGSSIAPELPVSGTSGAGRLGCAYLEIVAHDVASSQSQYTPVKATAAESELGGGRCVGGVVCEIAKIEVELLAHEKSHFCAKHPRCP
jgi:hypothetical protein